MPKLTSRYIEVCIFRIENDVPRFLLLRRRAGETLYPGIWQIVTGTREHGETAVDAALRELSEETGTRPLAFWSVPHISALYTPGNDEIELHPMFAAQVSSGADPVLSPEHGEFGWFSLKEAIRMLVWPDQREGVGIVHDFIIRGEKAGILTRIF